MLVAVALMIAVLGNGYAVAVIGGIIVALLVLGAGRLDPVAAPGCRSPTASGA